MQSDNAGTEVYQKLALLDELAKDAMRYGPPPAAAREESLVEVVDEGDQGQDSCAGLM